MAAADLDERQSRSREKSRPEPASYEGDFYTWTIEQAAALRAGRLSDLDRDKLAEEIEDLGKEQFSKLESALRIILLHLLKWDHQPERRSRSWAISIDRERIEYDDILRDNPGLKSRREDALERAYRKARLEAANETGLPRRSFPTTSAYSLSDALTRLIDWPEP